VLVVLQLLEPHAMHPGPRRGGNQHQLSSPHPRQHSLPAPSICSARHIGGALTP
jgi:hypothetical protein